MKKLLSRNVWVIQQKKEWGEILTNFETRNKYEILDERGERVGFIAEESGGLFGFVKRGIMRSHRSFTALIFNAEQRPVLRIRRPWYFIWSSMGIETPDGKKIGSVHRRFKFIGRRYDLLDAQGRQLGGVEAGVFRIWRFDLVDSRGAKTGEITKKWGGLLKEVYTDADRFVIALEGTAATLQTEAKAVFLGAAVALDFDYFDNNVKRN